MGAAYYNEIEPSAAQWLRELIKAGHIAPGDVDERSIVDVKADELKGYTQCHFFAGIGVWSAALRLAGIPDSRPVWSGSCPCQGYSVAGNGEGTDDDRDLWPVFASLIRERGPTEVYGEQVAAAIGYGWLDRVRTDLEAENYAVGGVVLGAHSSGADHIRQRLWWMAHAGSTRKDFLSEELRSRDGASCKSSGDGGMGDSADSHGGSGECGSEEGAGSNGLGGRGSSESSGDLRLPDSERSGLEGLQHGRGTDPEGYGRDTSRSTGSGCGEMHPNLWSDSRWHQCRDGKARRIPVEPRLFPLVDARSQKGFRVAALRGAGNAINIGTAAMFIEAHNTKETA